MALAKKLAALCTSVRHRFSVQVIAAAPASPEKSGLSPSLCTGCGPAGLALVVEDRVVVVGVVVRAVVVEVVEVVVRDVVVVVLRVVRSLAVGELVSVG